MDNTIDKTVKKKSVPNRISNILSSSKTAENHVDSSRHDDEDWDYFVPVNSSRPNNDNDEFNQSNHLQGILQTAMGHENNVFGDGDDGSSHIIHQHSSNSTQLFSSSSGSTSTPRTSHHGSSPFFNLSFRKRDFSTSLHPSSHSLEIIEDDKEFDVSRTAKGSFKSLGTYLSLVTMKAMPRIMFGGPKKISIDGENMEVMDLIPYLSSNHILKVTTYHHHFPSFFFQIINVGIGCVRT